MFSLCYMNISNMPTTVFRTHFSYKFYISSISQMFHLWKLKHKIWQIEINGNHFNNIVICPKNFPINQTQGVLCRILHSNSATLIYQIWNRNMYGKLVQLNQRPKFVFCFSAVRYDRYLSIDCLLLVHLSGYIFLLAYMSSSFKGTRLSFVIKWLLGWIMGIICVHAYMSWS